MKFLKYSYKQLNLFTLLASTLLLLWMYRQNIVPTLELRNQCIQMQGQLEKAGHAPYQLNILRNEQKKLNRVSGNSKLSNEEIRQAILGNTHQFSKQVTVTSIKEPHIYDGPQMQVLTHALDLQGNFRELVKVTHDFESRFSDARLSAVKYYSLEDARTKKTTLYATYYFQNFKKH